MTIGQRIKRIREFRGLTQKELGQLLGFKKGCDVRIAQYEAGSRVPKKKMLLLLAKVLEVDVSVLSPTVGISLNDLMQTILWWEDMKGGGDIYDCIKAWETMKKKRDKGKITEDEYFEWKLTRASLPTGVTV